jgi:hypothetical protein
MRKSKPLKNDKSERINEYDNTDGNKNTDKNTLIELIIVITRARRTGINILLSSQPGMQKIMGVEISFKALFTSENL